MDYIALDTDVASNLIKRQIPPALLAKLARYSPCVTFVTLGELTKDYQDFTEHGLKLITSGSC